MATVDRRPYESAMTLTQSVLDASLDNLTVKLEMIADIDTPVGTIHVSDVAKYVGGTYYANRVTFPTVERSLPDWLGELEFPSLSLTLNNSDKYFSNVLPGGADYNGWIGRRVTVKVGLGEITSSYQTIFTGLVTEVGGFSRTTSTFTLEIRSDFEAANITLPNQLLIPDDFPDIEDDFVGLGAPIIYGDWTTNLRAEAPEVPAFPVNGANANVIAGTDPVRCVIAGAPLAFVDTTSVVLYRGTDYFAIPGVDVSIVPLTDNQIIDIAQQGFMIDGNPWIYENGDQFFLKCTGVDIPGYSNNIVAQARDLLLRFTNLLLGDFDSTWDYFRDKASPAVSAISLISSRVWIQESVEAMKQVASMLQQVRLEFFQNKDNQLSLTSLHFEEITPPSFSIKNWDVVLQSFSPKIDDRNNWNRAKADYRFSPPTGENSRSTALYRNNGAIIQSNREISKLVVFPNIINEFDVVNQLKEMIKLASGYSEIIDVNLTPRFFLQEIGDYINLDVNIGAVEFGYSDVVGMVRSVGYEPVGRAIKTKIWSFQMINFPGYSGPSGTVGGSTAIITKET